MTSTEERQQRVAQGSRRKRDLAAMPPRENLLTKATEWARANVPDEDPALAGMAAFMLKHHFKRTPTPDEVRARLKAQGRMMAQLAPHIKDVA